MKSRVVCHEGSKRCGGVSDSLFKRVSMQESWILTVSSPSPLNLIQVGK